MSRPDTFFIGVVKNGLMLKTIQAGVALKKFQLIR